MSKFVDASGVQTLAAALISNTKTVGGRSIWGEGNIPLASGGIIETTMEEIDDMIGTGPDQGWYLITDYSPLVNGNAGQLTGDYCIKQILIFVAGVMWPSRIYSGYGISKSEIYEVSIKIGSLGQPGKYIQITYCRDSRNNRAGFDFTNLGADMSKHAIYKQNAMSFGTSGVTYPAIARVFAATGNFYNIDMTALTHPDALVFPAGSYTRAENITFKVPGILQLCPNSAANNFVFENKDLPIIITLADNCTICNMNVVPDITSYINTGQGISQSATNLVFDIHVGVSNNIQKYTDITVHVGCGVYGGIHIDLDDTSSGPSITMGSTEFDPAYERTHVGGINGSSGDVGCLIWAETYGQIKSMDSGDQYVAKTAYIIGTITPDQIQDIG